MQGVLAARLAPLLVVLGAAAGSHAYAQSQEQRPPATHLEALAFDSARGRLVLFGGSRRVNDSTWVEGGETWEWDDAAGWRLTVGDVAGPGRRRAHGMAYDPERRVVLLVGGVRERGAGRGGDDLLNDVWSYDGRRWTRDPADAPTLATPQMAYDTRRRTMLLAGYRSDQPGRRWLVLYRRDAGGSWRLVDSAGPMTTGPLRVAYDAARGVLVVPALADSAPAVWEWNGSGWRRDPAAGPSRRTRYGFAFDGRTGRAVLLGGRGESPRELLDDAWSWDGARWTELPRPAGTQPHPGARASTTLLFDPARPRLALYGGLSSGSMVNELWLLDGGGWRRW